MDKSPTTTEQLHKNIIVLGLSGNSGKTVASEFILYQNIAPSTLLRISSPYDYRVYEDAPNAANQMKSTGSSKLTDLLVDTNKTIILDVAASNYEQFIVYLNDSMVVMKKPSQLIVPVTADKKSLKDALCTSKDLLKIEGVRSDDITIVFNMVKYDDDLDNMGTVEQFISELEELGVKHNRSMPFKKTPYFDELIEVNRLMPPDQTMTHEDIAKLNLDELIDACEQYRRSKNLSEQDKLDQNLVIGKIKAKRTYNSAMSNAKQVLDFITTEIA